MRKLNQRPLDPMRNGAGAATFLFLVGLATAPLSAGEEPTSFKILTEREGIHRVSFEELERAGLPPGTDRLALTNRGRTVPMLRRDPDGRFGPGDEILFHAEHLEGEFSYYHEHTPYNVYFLEPERAGSLFEPIDPPSASAASNPEPLLSGRRHFEKDKMLMRFGATGRASSSDAWFWARLTQIDQEPFRLDLDLADLEPNAPLRLRVALGGWSRLIQLYDPPQPDHVVDLSVNGHYVDSAEWSGQKEHLLEAGVDAAILRAGLNEIELRVAPRVPVGGEDPLVDVVLLNWIEIEYPRRGVVESHGQDAFVVDAVDAASTLTAHTREPDRLLAFGERTVHTPATTSAGTAHRIALPASFSGRLTIVRDGAFFAPVAVLPSRPSRLRSAERQADYLMISHPRLLDALEPLAEFHRRRGLTVERIDVFDIYDEFNHGIVHPRAIRDLVAFAYHEWRPPAPRFVLLVGDASWDVKNETPDHRNYADWTYQHGEVQHPVRNQMTPYEEGVPLDRNLIPTWKYYGAQGHAASDNYFVAVEGDDHLPDLAIGRFTVVSSQEVEAIVDKTIDYMRAPRDEPWQRNILWITNESPLFQRRSDTLAEEMQSRGFRSTKIYPSSEEADNAEHQASLLAALEKGQAVVHFLGHGGRYIWRTGPPDFRKNHDLFTLDHLDRLAPTHKLPVVLSMTCYSAPFDHPTADSIGEKFLRLPDRGAVAVLAASWRNSPTQELSREILLALVGSRTLGEAVLEAKRATARRDLIETYNLLGDPALVLPVHADGSETEAARR